MRAWVASLCCVMLGRFSKHVRSFPQVASLAGSVTLTPFSFLSLTSLVICTTNLVMVALHVGSAHVRILRLNLPIAALFHLQPEYLTVLKHPVNHPTVTWHACTF